ncbi:TetR/AcrR family transcriptional regulator, partial [Nocardia cyriacigeorgica]|uniref:TetR/AcrR family transcriptional regulator n=1 Tax=Nocardia cyriacigeorgica TaxID=135487 RepID=UPI0024563B57
MADRRAETTRESRRLLIEAAAGLFVEKGYQQTTFADVAARSGVSRGSIPWHFGNKEGLLAAVLDDAGNALLAGPGGPGRGRGARPPANDNCGGNAPAVGVMWFVFVGIFGRTPHPGD